MILHLSPDDPFINYAVKHFDKYGNSDFVVVQNGGASCEVNYDPRIKVLSAKGDLQTLCKSLSKYNAVIFHGLYGHWVGILLPLIPKNVKIAWMCWGGEVYGREDSLKWLDRISSLFYRVKQCARNIKRKAVSQDIIPVDMMKHVSFCMLDMQEELEYANALFSTSMDMLPYNYYSITDVMGNLLNSFASGNNVFVGNCCAIDGNLPDVYLRLRRVGVTDLLEK